MTEQPLSVSANFHRIDETAEPNAFFRFLDARRDEPWFAAELRSILDLLDPRPGNTVLDLGCGLGDQSRAIASIVGENGSIVGIDASAAMVAEARRRSEGLTVRFETGDARRLEFEDGSFDRCLTNALLVHLDDPAATIAELVRLTRPGGRIVANDPDTGSQIVDLPDRALTQKLLAYRATFRDSGWTGRRLPRLFREAGLVDVTVRPNTIWTTDPSPAMNGWLPPSIEQAREAGVLTSAEADNLLADIEEVTRSGNYFFAMTWFVVGGRKPSLS